jgi:CRISPR-associated protein Csd2
VCLKRKVRNFIQLTQADNASYDIYVKEKAVLGRSHVQAFNDLGIALGEESRKPVPAEFLDEIQELSLPEGLKIDEEDDKSWLVVAADADVKVAKDSIKQAKPSKALEKFLQDSLKGVKARKPSADETSKGRDWMCSHFFDIRTFGAVMSLKSAPNCGQVRGPIQLTFARSVEPVVTLEHSITRMAVATEAEAEKQGGDNRTMGRKFTVPYGLYRGHGFVSAHLANQTGFSQEDLELFWKAVEQMFEHDRSAARGLMSTRALLVFEHDLALGNAPAHKLFERVTIPPAKNQPARSFSDYEPLFDGKALPPVGSMTDLGNGVKLLRKV